MSQSTQPVKLNDEQIDDLLYCARAGELEDLGAYLDELVPPSTQEAVKAKQAVLAQVVDGSGNGMFHYVCANGHLDTFNLLSPLSSLSLLLHQNSSGNTPLHWAGLNGHLPLVKALVERIEDLEKEDTEGAKVIREKQREEEMKRRAESKRKRRQEAAKQADEDKKSEAATSSSEDKKTAPSNGDAELDDDEEEDTPELSLWDLRNSFGRGPTSESQMNDRENVVQFLLTRMAAGGGAEPASTKPNQEDVQELEQKTKEASLEDKDGEAKGQEKDTSS